MMVYDDGGWLLVVEGDFATLLSTLSSERG